MVIINDLLDLLIQEEKKPKSSNLTNYGFIYGLFIQANSRFEVIRQKIEEKLKDEKFVGAVKHIIHVRLSDVFRSQYEILSKDKENFIAKRHVDNAISDINYLVNNSIFDYAAYIFRRDNDRDLQDTNYKYIKENYVYYIIVNELFTLRKQTIIQDTNHTSIVFEIYKESKVDLEMDIQYSKYSLVSIESNWLKYNTSEAYIYDPRINKNFTLRYIPVEVSIFLIELIDKGYINELAIKPDANSFQNGENRISPFNEEVQFGKVFSFGEFKNIKITKLYSTNVNDSLWVAIDDSNITFEELVNDFHITDKNEIITQVVHMEYKVVDNQIAITHIDHEYIYYSFDEYEKRANNFRQKGEARKREKTFKVDKSCIPFVSEDNTSLVYIILRAFFKNIDLIDEYFMNVIKDN